MVAESDHELIRGDDLLAVIVKHLGDRKGDFLEDVLGLDSDLVAFV